MMQLQKKLIMVRSRQNYTKDRAIQNHKSFTNSPASSEDQSNRTRKERLMSHEMNLLIITLNKS